MKNRRDFIKQSCNLCLGIVGIGALVTQVSSCAPLPVYKTITANGTMSVPVASFTENNAIVIVRNPDLQYDIALIKKTATDYTALQLQCTHQANSLTATKTAFICPSHGSTFDLEGKVMKEPALLPLKKYKTKLINASIIINLS